MALSGYIIVFAPNVNDNANYFWDGTQQIPLSTTNLPDSAQFFDSRSDARLVAGDLMEQFPNQELAIVPATMTVAATFGSTPQVKAPEPPAP